MRLFGKHSASRETADRQAECELQRLGYRQQFARTMGGFSSFAVSFSLISIITGIFTNFGHGLRQVGPAIVWSWTVAVLGQLLVALVVAELANRFPVSGYGYQWASRLIGPRFGFFVGWMLLSQWLAGFPGICKTLAEQLHGFASYYVDPPPVPLLTLAIISVIAVIHLWGIRLASMVNDVGVLAEIAGVAAIIVALLAVYLASGRQPASLLAQSTNYATGSPASFSAFALSLLLGAWCLTGFEGAADLAEETHRPRQTVPKAVIMSELSSGIGGLLLLAAFVLSIPTLSEVQASQHPLLDIIRLRLGARMLPAFWLLIAVSIFACGVASMAATTRLLFALARDNMLPCSRLLSQIDPAHRTPRNAIVTIWLLACGLVVLLERADALDIITALATITGYLGYGGIVLSAMIGLRGALAAGGFELGRWRLPVAAMGLIWTLIVVLALIVPSDAASHPYAPVVAFAVTGGIGLALYLAVVAPRIARGIAGPPITELPTHQIQQPASVMTRGELP